jgi:hypothetical protein
MGIAATKTLNPWKVAGYKAGQPVTCTVLRAEPGGYSVSIAKSNLSGFLATSNKLKPGQEVLARFVCLHNQRILLTCSFSGTESVKTTPTVVSLAPEAAPPAASEADAAFSVWASESPKSLPFRRATDLIVPSIDPSLEEQFVMKERGKEWVITDIEGGMRTGCIQIISEKNQTRSAILLYKGRSVGCIFGDKDMGNGVPKELALGHTLKQLEDEDAQIRIYPLTDDITLPLSALFYGYPVERSDNLDTRSYLDYLLEWLAGKKQTACIAISFATRQVTCLLLVYQGKFTGAFHIDRQEFSTTIDPVHNLLKAEPTASFEASILPVEIVSPAMHFGHSLSMAHKQIL